MPFLRFDTIGELEWSRWIIVKKELNIRRQVENGWSKCIEWELAIVAVVLFALYSGYSGRHWDTSVYICQTETNVVTIVNSWTRADGANGWFSRLNDIWSWWVCCAGGWNVKIVRRRESRNGTFERVTNEMPDYKNVLIVELDANLSRTTTWNITTNRIWIRDSFDVWTLFKVTCSPAPRKIVAIIVIDALLTAIWTGCPHSLDIASPKIAVISPLNLAVGSALPVQTETSSRSDCDRLDIAHVDSSLNENVAI